MHGSDSINYKNFVKKKRENSISLIKKIILEKEGIWLNEADYDGSSFTCIVRCKLNHEFSIRNESIKRNRWCSICSGTVRKGETISKIILENILDFKLNKTRKIENLISSDTFYPLEIDGFNEEHKFGFEYNGNQHFKYNKFIHPSIADYNKTIQNDEIKKSFFKENKWKLLIIPQFKNFNIESNVNIIISLIELLDIPYNKNFSYDIIKSQVNEELYFSQDPTNQINNEMNGYKGKYYFILKDWVESQGLYFASGNFNEKNNMISLSNRDKSITVERTITFLLKRFHNNIKILDNRRKSKPKIIKPQRIKTNNDEDRLNEILICIQKYEYLKDFRLNNIHHYEWLRRHNLLNDVTKNLIKNDSKSKFNRKFDIEYLKIIAKKYTTKKQFYKGNFSEFVYARRNNLMNEICGHMIGYYRGYSRPSLIPDNILIEIAKQYNSKVELRKENDAIYREILKRKLQNIAFSTYPAKKST